MRDHGVEDKWEALYDTSTHPGIELAAIDGVDCDYCHSEKRHPCRIVLDHHGPGSFLPDFAHISRRMAWVADQIEKRQDPEVLLKTYWDHRKRGLDRDRAVEDLLGFHAKGWTSICLNLRDGIEPRKKPAERPDNCIHHEADGVDGLLGF